MATTLSHPARKFIQNIQSIWLDRFKAWVDIDI
jgi:hypothetical protein